MFDKEVEEIQAVYMEVTETFTSKGGKTRHMKLNRIADEWIKLFPDLSNTISKNENDFRDMYAFYRISIFPSIDGYELFRYFYNNKFNKIHVQSME